MCWNREQVDAALKTLDAEIESMLERSQGMPQFWAAFDDAAFEIQVEAEHDMWYAAAQLDRMLVRHGLIPRAGVFPLPRPRPMPLPAITPDVAQVSAMQGDARAA